MIKYWVALYTLITAIYFITASGRVGGSDPESMFNVTRSLVTRGNLSADPCVPAPRSNHCVPGVDGRNYAGFGLAPSLIAVPAYIIGAAVASVLHRDTHVVEGLVLSLYHAPLAATVPLVLALWIYRIGLPRAVAMWVALLYAFTTPAWSSSRGFGSQPYFCLGLVGCCYFLASSERITSLLAAGSCFGFACGCRIYGLILAPAIFLYGFLIWRSRSGNVARIARNLTLTAAPMAVALSLIAWSNLARFGSILKTGYHLNYPSIHELLSNPLLVGMRDLLIDHEVGLFIFVPWTLMIPLLWTGFWKRIRSEAILTLTIFSVNFVFFAKYSASHGGWAIGPRMLYETIPFVTLPLAVLLERSYPIWETGIGRLTAVLVAAAFVIQLVMTPYTGFRYFTMETYNRAHGLHPWWSGEPLFEAVTALPELLFGRGDFSANPAHQYLLTFPNSVNLVRADIWLFKAPLFGVPAALVWALAAVLFFLGALSLRTLRPALAPVDRTVQAS